MDEQLHKAISTGNLAEVHRLVENGASINNLCGMKGTPLCAAIYTERTEIVDFLLEKQCDINAKDFDGEPPLCLAIQMGKYSLASRLIREPKCDLNRIDATTGYRPIHIAIRSGHLDTVRQLVNKGCDINVRDIAVNSGNTALHTACFNREKEIAKFLIESNCNVYATNDAGYLPLHICIKAQNMDTLCLILDKTNQTISDTAEKQRLLNFPTKAYAHTPIILAITTENIDAAFELIKRGCNVNSRNFHGETALFHACKMNFPDLVCSLLEAGAEPNALPIDKQDADTSTGIYHCSPIHQAIGLGNLFIVKKLVEYGADLNIVESVSNPLCFALLRNKAQIADYLLDIIASRGLEVWQETTTKFDNHPLIAVASCTNPAYFAKRMINLRCDVNHERGIRLDVSTPLINAVEYECNELTEVLLEYGADPEVRNPYLTSLQLAASLGCIAPAATLIQWGAEVNGMDAARSNTALYYALTSGNMNIAHMLLHCGCTVHEELLDPDSLDLDSYCLDDEKEEIEMLLQFNASNPLPLSFLCRNLVKQCFKSNYKSISCVSSLNLPSRIQNFIRHKDLDEYKLLDA